MPLHRLPQHRQGDQRRCRPDEELTRWPRTGSALRSGARRTSASSPGPGTSRTTSTGPARSMPISSARPTRTPGSAASTRARRAAPGVLAVLTGDDVKAAGWGNLICGWMVKSRDGSDMKAGPHPMLAQGKVRYVGDAVACVVAETYQARDAAELVEVDYEELPACASTAHARDRARRRSTTTSRATRSTSGNSAIRRRSTRRSPAPRTSPGSIWSTIAWCRTRSSRAPRSPNTTAAARPRSTPRARTRTSRAW